MFGRSRFTGPICLLRHPVAIDDGTLALHSSSRGGVTGLIPSHAAKVSPAVQLTGTHVSQIAPKAAFKSEEVARILNQAIRACEITTMIGQAMFIAQVAHETGEFTGTLFIEDVDSTIVFNSAPTVDKKFTIRDPLCGSGKQIRYFQNTMNAWGRKGCLTAWRASKAAFQKAKTAYEQKHPGKKFESAPEGEKWAPKDPPDYVIGDVEYPYWQMWYDVGSPFDAASARAKKMGNAAPGDGRKYRGRGFVQLTWQCNYLEAQKGLKQIGIELPLLQNPDLAAEPVHVAKIAAWWWKKKGCNRYIKEDSRANFEAVTKTINPGLKHLEDRLKYYDVAKRVLSGTGTRAGETDLATLTVRNLC